MTLADSTTPLTAYDRQAHLAWYERRNPDAPNWPPYPRTNCEAGEYIAAYTGRQDELDKQTAGPTVDIAGQLAELLDSGLEVTFLKDPQGYIATIVEGNAVDLSTGIGDTVAGALEVAVTGLVGAS